MPSKISKRNFRQRAHSNPFKDTEIVVPTSPDAIDWKDYFKNECPPEYLDIGCGYGKFLMEVSKISQKNILGLEIRTKVAEYVENRIRQDGLINAGIMKTNALLFLPSIFSKGMLSKIFILFPDPHFKKRKQKGRVVCRQMMAVLDFILKEEGRIYISTDVKSLFDDMVSVISESGFFTQIENEKLCEDELFKLTYTRTDESLRAGIKTGCTFATIFKKNIN